MPENDSARKHDTEVFRISRTFDVPRDRMFRIWTDPKHLSHWWGPKDFTVKHATVDLRVGGLFHYCIAAPKDGGHIWGKFVFREIDPPNRLVFITSFSDEHGGITDHPMMDQWPRELLSTITFSEHDGKTTVEVEWIPCNATEAERKAFRDGRKSMQQGWSGTFEQLDSYINSKTDSD